MVKQNNVGTFSMNLRERAIRKISKPVITKPSRRKVKVERGSQTDSVMLSEESEQQNDQIEFSSPASKEVQVV